MGQLIGSSNWSLNSPFLLGHWSAHPLPWLRTPLNLTHLSTRSFNTSPFILISLQFVVQSSILHYEGFDSCWRVWDAFAAVGILSSSDVEVRMLIFT